MKPQPCSAAWTASSTHKLVQFQSSPEKSLCVVDEAETHNWSSGESKDTECSFINETPILHTHTSYICTHTQAYTYTYMYSMNLHAHTHTCLRTCSLKSIMQKLGSLKLNTTENWEKLSRYLPLLGFNSLQNLLFPDFFSPALSVCHCHSLVFLKPSHRQVGCRTQRIPFS